MSLKLPVNQAAEPMSPRASSNADDDDDYQSDAMDSCQDQDDAQAVLQPAMSARASRLTSVQTPAVEKIAAMSSRHFDGFFDIPVGPDDEHTSPEAGSSSENQTPSGGRASRPSHQQRLTDEPPERRNDVSLPSPWVPGPRPLIIEKERPSGGRHANTKSMLETAFGPARRRSRSAGQDALKRLQKAFPSLAAPSHLLPSFPSGFFSSPSSEKATSGKWSSGSSTPNRNRSTSTTSFFHSSTMSLQRKKPTGSPTSPQQPAGIQPSNHSPVRPKTLRRVTSDASLLYHSLSRQSSLGDDSQFQDVREMVNMRLMALKDSLPDVPSFKVPRPNLPKLPVKMSFPFAQSSSADVSEPRPEPDRASSIPAKEDSSVLDEVLRDLTGDVVIMGGYRGSILRSAEPPHQQVWAPVKLGFNMRKVDLEVGLTDEDEEKMEETIFPSGMLKHIGPIDVSRRLFKKLRSCENAQTGKLRIWDYGYDWRLSPPLLSRKLTEFLQKLPSNQPGVATEERGALVISHSLGGLITRHAVNQRPDLFSGVCYAGTPQRCVNILGPIRNGDVVLFNEKLLTAAVNFSIRTTFVFLPEDGQCFVDKNTGEEYRIDFYDPQEWVNWRFSPCIETPLPPFNKHPQSSSISSLLSSRLRSDSKLEKITADQNPLTDRTVMPQMNGHQPSPAAQPIDPERQRNYEYLTRTLAMIKKFRAEMAHSEEHQKQNAYPPHSVLYGKAIPTVHGAWVNGKEAIRHSDAYDDLIFRPGDGVTLAKEAMLPEGYAIARGGRVNTERGHITMLGDMPAMGKVFEALMRGRRKGIGLGPDRARER